MKKWLALLLACVLCFSLVACGQLGRSNDELILGTWTTDDDHWGEFQYIFYSDGSCTGTYVSRSTSGVQPSFFPHSYYEGSGDGTWSFVDGKLKIAYTGKRSGTQYYNIEFKSNGQEIHLTHQGTYDKTSQTIIWYKAGR